MKETKVLTVEEINEFKPSFEKPMSVECFDGYYESNLKNPKIISSVLNGEVALITDEETQKLYVLSADNLKHYASLKQPKTKTFYLWAVRSKNTEGLSTWHVVGSVLDNDLRNSKGDYFCSKLENYAFKRLDSTAIELEVNY